MCSKTSTSVAYGVCFSKARCSEPRVLCWTEGCVLRTLLALVGMFCYKTRSGRIKKIRKDTAICPCPVAAWPYLRRKHHVVSLCALFPPSFSNMLSLKHVGKSQLFCRMPQVERPCSLRFSTQQDLSLSITNYLERLPWPSRSFLLKTEWMLNVCWARSFPRWERLRTKKLRPFQHVVVFAHRRAEDRLALFIWPAWHSIR